MRYQGKAPTINSGSMADIAFLLLIFFLVTTTISNDKGIIRKLPAPCPPGENCDVRLNERNVLRISLNEKGELLVNNELTEVIYLNKLLKEFIDNNGDRSCQYCSGVESELSSINPQEATINLTTHRETPYSHYITVQNELTKAYLELRESYVTGVLKKEIASVSSQDILKVQKAYPIRITEASTQ